MSSSVAPAIRGVPPTRAGSSTRQSSGLQSRRLLVQLLPVPPAIEERPVRSTQVCTPSRTVDPGLPTWRHPASGLRALLYGCMKRRGCVSDAGSIPASSTTYTLVAKGEGKTSVSQGESPRPGWCQSVVDGAAKVSTGRACRVDSRRGDRPNRRKTCRRQRQRLPSGHRGLTRDWATWSPDGPTGTPPRRGFFVFDGTRGHGLPVY